MQTYSTHEEVLEVLHRQGSDRITLEVLQDHASLIDDWRDAEGEHYPCLAFQNGVRWFFDKERRPTRQTQHGPQPVKCLAPAGSRALLAPVKDGEPGDLEDIEDPVLIEGERDWLTAVSIGLTNAVCIGGVDNLEDHQKRILGQKRNVVLLFDNDEPGRRAAHQIAAEVLTSGAKKARIAFPGVAGADLTDWIHSLTPGVELDACLELIRQADSIGKREAKQILKEAEQQAEASKPEPSDEFVSNEGDPVALVWVPPDPQVPHRTEGGYAAFLRYDVERSKKNGILVTEEHRKWEPGDPKDPDLEASHGMYGAPKGPHAQQGKAPVVPIGGETFEKRITVLPSGADEHGTSEELFDHLVDLINRYFVIDEPFIHAMAAYAMLTYRYRDAEFEVLPYIRVMGRGGSGKTRFLRIMRELCYRSIFVTGMRPVHLYRILKHMSSSVTMVFEEFNINDRSEENREFVNMLNAGNQSDTYVPRMTGRNFEDIEYLPLFCPKILTMKDEFTDEGLIRRFFSARTGQMEVPESKRFEKLPEEFYRECAQLRRKLLGWRFAKFGQPAPEIDKSFADGIEPGIWQTFYPAICMVPSSRPDSINKILSLATNRQENLKLARETDQDAVLIEAIGHLAATEGHGERAHVEHVVRDLLAEDPRERWTQQDVLRRIRNLELTLRRTKQTVAGIRRNVWVVLVDEKWHEEAKRRSAGIAEVAEERGRTAPEGIM